MSYRKDAHNIKETSGVVHADAKKTNDPVAQYTQGRISRILKIDQATVFLIGQQGQNIAVQFWNNSAVKESVGDYKVGIPEPLKTLVSASTILTDTTKVGILAILDY